MSDNKEAKPVLINLLGTDAVFQHPCGKQVVFPKRDDKEPKLLTAVMTVQKVDNPPLGILTRRGGARLLHAPPEQPDVYYLVANVPAMVNFTAAKPRHDIYCLNGISFDAPDIDDQGRVIIHTLVEAWFDPELSASTPEKPKINCDCEDCSK